jgi:hypothetical protein
MTTNIIRKDEARLFTRIQENVLTDGSSVFDLILEDEGMYLACFPCITLACAIRLQEAMTENAIGVYHA